jgi:hypothetical protein
MQRSIDMKIQTIVNLTEAQKARIVSRNEQLPQRICTFEMSPEKAEIISRLRGNYMVTREPGENSIGSDIVMIIATDDQYSYQRLSVEEIKDANWQVAQQTIFLQDVLAEAYAAGTVAQGANIDFALNIMAEALKRREAIQENNKVIEAEKARKEEEDRPAREAQAKADAEAKAERERTEAEEKARQDEDNRVRKALIESEKKAWIEEHGSERLQKGYAMGYNCQKIYEIERAQSILGSDYIRISADEKVRSCPSLEALQEVERLNDVTRPSLKISSGSTLQVPVNMGAWGQQIVWLPHGPDGEDETGCEAVKADPGTFSSHYFYRIFK